MRKRHVALAGALGSVAALLTAASITVKGQPATSSGGASAAPRTPWGTADLQGIWDQTTVTPLERPSQFASREFLTDEERAAAEQQLVRQGNTPGRNRDIRNERGTEQDVAGAYNAVWERDRPTKAGRRTSIVIDPPDGRIPATTVEVQSRLAAQRDYLNALPQGTSGGLPGPVSPLRYERPPVYNLDRMNRADGPEDRSGGERCFGSVMPPIGALQRIVQSPDSVQIFYDIGQGGGFSRVIPITDRPHLPSHIRQFYGDARGRWEGDTLVVDVVNFTNRSRFRGSRVILHLIERYTRADENTLVYQVTVEDPTTWTRPYGTERRISRRLRSRWPGDTRPGGAIDKALSEAIGVVGRTDPKHHQRECSVQHRSHRANAQYANARVAGPRPCVSGPVHIRAC